MLINYSSMTGQGYSDPKNKYTPDSNYPSNTPAGQGFYWKRNQNTGDLEKAPNHVL